MKKEAKHRIFSGERSRVLVTGKYVKVVTVILCDILIIMIMSYYINYIIMIL
jgi:hypothetical protein